VTRWELHVAGDPRPKGSWCICPRCRPRIVAGEKCYPIKGLFLKADESERLAQWKHQIEIAVLEAGRPKVPLVDVAIKVSVLFILARPLKPKAAVPIVAPDVDKLQRAIGDVLQGVYYANDSQIVDWSASKRYGAPGAHIVITALDEQIEIDI
jgi:Holliday junction resolvase RusA-like endonuclease